MRDAPIAEQPPTGGLPSAEKGLDAALMLVELLVLSLRETGHLDEADFADRLLYYRHDHTAPASLRRSAIERMLGLLADQPLEVVLRRYAMLRSADESETGSGSPLDLPASPASPGEA